MAETSLERILEQVEALKPAALVVDSVQTVFSSRFPSAPGSISQVREVATQLLFLAKGRGVTTFLIGHVTKDGSIAGPKSLEHIVDTVLYFEGEKRQHHRIVRAVKNRFGAVSELGVFEMTGAGLKPVANPSALFLSERQAGAPGSAVVCTIEGSRPMLVEVQALVSPTSFGTPRRMSLGIDPNRTSLLLAVLEKRVGLELLGDDVFVSVAGGLEVDEPAADLGVAAAVASSFRNRPLPAHTVLFGEVGLGGEVRGAAQAGLRVREAEQMGFTRCILPARNIPDDVLPGIRLIGVNSLEEALERLADGARPEPSVSRPPRERRECWSVTGARPPWRRQCCRQLQTAARVSEGRRRIIAASRDARMKPSASYPSLFAGTAQEASTCGSSCSAPWSSSPSAGRAGTGTPSPGCPSPVSPSAPPSPS